jgi:hypothetical protein
MSRKIGICAKDSTPRSLRFSCVIDGIQFSSIQDIADHLNVKYDTFIKYKYRTKCTTEEAYYYFKKKLDKG